MMREGVHTGNVRDTGRRPVHAPLRLLALCLSASLALHALVFLFFPRWTRPPVIPPIPVLDVVMVSREPEARPLPPAVPRELTPVIPEHVIGQRPPPAPAPKRTVTETPVVPAQPNPITAPVFTVPAEPQRPAAESSPVPAARVEPEEPPAFNAAYLQNPPPRYPMLARRNGDQGTVMVRVLVSAAGVPVRVELETSSGSPPLDDAALDAVKEWRFVPARRGAKNIEGWVWVPIVFRLDS